MMLNFQDKYDFFPAFLVNKILTIFVGFKAHIRQHLSREARGCDCLVLWLDCDREGENICFEGTYPPEIINPIFVVLLVKII